MNLFADSISSYIEDKFDDVFQEGCINEEVRIFVQSVRPNHAEIIFNRIEDYCTRSKYQFEQHLKIAKGLYDVWKENENINGPILKRISERGWIDNEDKLTYYRNKRLTSGYEHLVVILIGLDHAVDRGGLADFHVVKEAQIWKQLLGESYEQWTYIVFDKLRISEDESGKLKLNNVLVNLFKIKGRDLEQLAEFFETRIFPEYQGINSTQDLIDLIWENLPFWRIPPLFNMPVATKESIAFLKLANKFISRRMFPTHATRIKTIDKINKAIDEGQLQLPHTVRNDVNYSSVDEFQQTLVEFINESSTVAREKLLKTDLFPLLNVLRQREVRRKRERKSRIIRLKGFSIEAFLQGIWVSLKIFKKQCGNEWAPDLLTDVQIEVSCFNHDLEDDDTTGQSRHEIAKGLMNCCLGGLDEFLVQLEFLLPMDKDSDIWNKLVPITLKWGRFEGPVLYRVNRIRPTIEFWVHINSAHDHLSLSQQFQWQFDSNSAERVMYHLASKVHSFLNENPNLLLPGFHLSRTFAELFFSADSEDVNRLLNEGITSFEIIDLLQGVSKQALDDELWQRLVELREAYAEFLKTFLYKGYYIAANQSVTLLVKAYESMAELLIAHDLRGREDLLHRFYKAFLVTPKDLSPTETYIPNAVAIGVTPAVVELSQARDLFLRDGFAEVAAHLLIEGPRSGNKLFDRLLGLSELRRPIVGLICDIQNVLSTRTNAFGLTHCFGGIPRSDLSLASQAILREEEIDDDDDIRELIRPSEESRIILRVLQDYLKLHPYSNDSIRILVANVRDLHETIAGVHQFLFELLSKQTNRLPEYRLFLKTLTTSASPSLIEKRLSAWRNFWIEHEFGENRACTVDVAHSYTPDLAELSNQISRESESYDVSILLRFLDREQQGDADPSEKFVYDFNEGNIRKFPICEYPQPVNLSHQKRRRSLLSNRRLRIQTAFGDMSARLKHKHYPDRHFLLHGQVDFSQWKTTVDNFHKISQWVACIDPYIDKNLLELEGDFDNSDRKIVGYSSGLGSYGELNLTISTETDTLSHLTNLIREQLQRLFPAWNKLVCEKGAKAVVTEAQEMIGVSLIRAVGESEYIRDVVGYSIVQRALQHSATSLAVEWIPIDSFKHWFKDIEIEYLPDLICFETFLTDQSFLTIKATLVECKLAGESPQHLAKATEQVKFGLQRLVKIFMPNTDIAIRPKFDRRYWWAQLQRAIATRMEINLSDSEYKSLNAAFERLTSGYFRIEWQAVIVTIWNNRDMLSEQPKKIDTALTIENPLIQIPSTFSIWHVAYGSNDARSLLIEESHHRFSITSEPLVFESNLVANIRKAYKPDKDTSKEVPKTQDVKLDDDERTVSDETEYVPPLDEIAQPRKEVSIGNAFENERNVSMKFQEKGISSVPRRIFLGKQRSGDKVYWEFGHSELNNRHILIFGASGSGKTYAIQCILAELARQNQGSLIIDYTDGFLPSQVASAFNDTTKLQQHLIDSKNPLPINPFRRYTKEIEGFPTIQEDAFAVASRVASVFMSVYNTIGEQQSARLIKVIEEGIERSDTFKLSDLLTGLEAEGDVVGKTLAAKITPFVKANPFQPQSKQGWTSYFMGNDVHVMQLTPLSRDLRQLITEFLLWDIYDFVMNNGDKDIPVPIVLDEIQNLDHKSDSAIEKMLREGRKFGVSLILATQTMSNFNSEERDRLFQASHKLFFKPADTETRRYAEILSTNVPFTKRDDWEQKLSRLQKGQCWSLGPAEDNKGKLSPKVVLVDVTKLEERQ